MTDPAIHARPAVKILLLRVRVIPRPYLPRRTPQTVPAVKASPP